METTYYTLNAREIIAEGETVASASGAPARQLVCVRRPVGQKAGERDNVIDLAEWKAAREEEARLEEEWDRGADQRLDQPEAAAGRCRRERPALLGGEMAATLSVIGAMAMLMVRILAF